MKLTRLKSESEILEFQNQAAQYIKVRFPISYLRQGRVFGFYNEAGEMVGGFSFIRSENLRTLESFPHVRSELPKKLTELTGLWLSPKVRDRKEVLKFWLQLSACAIPELGSTLIFAYSAHKQGLKKLYSPFSPKEIYLGPVKALEGMDGEDTESINIVPATRLVFFPLINFQFYAQRALRSSRFARRFNEPVFISLRKTFR